MEKIINVPKEFMDMSVINYPPHQKSMNIEAKLFLEISKNDARLNSNLSYLPIQWTNYLVKNGYGKNVKDLQLYINSLPKNKKYFSVIQYAGGPLVDIDNIIIFSAGGIFNTKINDNLSYISIPLISDKHKNKVKIQNKKYLASYLGRKTHEIREEIENIYKENKKFYVKNLDSMNISYFDSIKFKRIMRNSIFSLCPRGFGPTSFRLYEAIQMGTIPVYIAEKNEHILPFANKIDWKKLCVIANISDLKSLDKKLISIVEKGEHKEKLKYGNYCLENFLNYDFISKEIIRTVNLF